jgi:DnaJ-class molecular chaperone
VSDESECTICEGGGGWWVTVPPQRAVGRIRCEHCEGTGVEPEPTPIEEEL